MVYQLVKVVGGNIECEAKCGESLTIIGSSNVRKMWNEGHRGWVENI